MAHDVFISYSANDRETADAACRFLEDRGIRCWIAPRDASPGTPWAAALVEAIQASRAMLLVFSSRSNESEHVLREVGAAGDAGIPILPLRTESTLPSKELGYYIGRAHWLDAIVPPLASHLPRLEEALRRLLEAPAQRTPEASPERIPLPAPHPESQGGSAAHRFGSRRARAIALGVLVVLVLCGLALAWQRRSGTLTIESEPADALATVDGAPAGSTPLVLPIASGAHGVSVRRLGFKDWSKVVDVAAGEKASFSLQLVVADARDAASVNLLAKGLGIELQGYALPEAQRAPPEGEPLELIVPRGTVRPADVTALVMDADPERIEPSGTIAVKRGTETLWETPFDPQTSRFEVAVPAQVRDGLRAGETIVWGWWPKNGPPVTLTLEVVAGDVAALFAELDRRLAPQSEDVRGHLRVQGLLDHRLFTGAFLEARAFAKRDPADLRAAAAMEQALSRSGGGELRVVARIRNELRNAPEADRARVFGPTGGPTDK